MDSVLSLTDSRRQKMFAGYSLGISLFSPMANLYQIKRLHPSVNPSYLRMCASIYPHQVGLRMLQVNLATPVKEHMNPWLAFGTLGVLQGCVYGQANVSFAKKLNLTRSLKLRNIFRGSGYAGVRDVISQGVPFMFSKKFSQRYLDPIWPSNDPFTNSVKHWSSVISTSVVATYLSHGFHVCQTEMQTNTSLSYSGAIRQVYKDHGWRFLRKGAEARVGLLLVTNIFNEIFLKPAWDER